MPKTGTPQQLLKPFWTTSDGEHVKLYHGNVTEVLSKLPAKSVHCCVTSPPYWGLRDYGTGVWEGGDVRCDHIEKTAEQAHRTSTLGPTAAQRAKGDLSREHPADNAAFKSVARQFAVLCGKCGAQRIDQQLGAEPSPDCKTEGQAQCGKCFVCSMVAVFRGVHRILRDDGTLWLNLGDSYSGSWGNYGAQNRGKGTQRNISKGSQAVNPAYEGKESWRPPTSRMSLPSGNLVGIPWRVALALQADGWILRSDIPWVKRAAMPESVKNRPAKALEYVFLFSKGMKYYFDMEPVRKALAGPLHSLENVTVDNSRNDQDRMGEVWGTSSGRSFRNSDLWFQSVDEPHGMVGIEDEIVGIDITTQGYAGAHFACYPPKLIEPMILAGTSEKGCCVRCGAPNRRLTEERKIERDRPNDYVKRTGEEGTGNSCSNSVAGVDVKAVGWEASCDCGADVVPCTVLDPFIGSGTTCSVSIENGRRSVGIDLNEEYLTNNAIIRIEGALLRRHDTQKLIPNRSKRVQLGKPLMNK